MPMLIRRVARSTQPHLPTLAATLAPLLALGTPASSFHLRYESGDVVIEQDSFTGVDVEAVDAAVANAPEHSVILDAKAYLDAMPPELEAIFTALVKLINTERAQHSRQAITKAALIQLAKDEL